jgi:hypothetical protein
MGELAESVLFTRSRVRRLVSRLEGEGARAPQDRRPTRHGGQGIVGRYGGEKHVAIDVLLSDGEHRLFWPCDLEEISPPSPSAWWSS